MYIDNLKLIRNEKKKYTGANNIPIFPSLAHHAIILLAVCLSQQSLYSIIQNMLFLFTGIVHMLVVKNNSM